MAYLQTPFGFPQNSRAKRRRCQPKGSRPRPRTARRQRAEASWSCNGRQRISPRRMGRSQGYRSGSLEYTIRGRDRQNRNERWGKRIKAKKLGKILIIFTTSVHLGEIWLQTAPTKSDPTAIVPKMMELAALEISGLAPPPAPIPLSAP